MVSQRIFGKGLGGLRRVRVGVDADNDFRASDGGSQGGEVAERRASLARDDRLSGGIDIVCVLLCRQSRDPRRDNLPRGPIKSLGVGTTWKPQPTRRQGCQNALKVGV